ncbi:D-alanyl-D-alanine carboxypeptidase [Robertmurraya korlensis]|uniref:D-alanyl-D-alanine carboxypeptidase family protein n=1 Tax=Robertmurraya korlensis TaxID=519977 RepID=UPI0020414D4D|nr:D-alanyl-D-alanine carboxypeptidase family protein [Robertmurraya korlensis]MCM3599725.1 D-alanyl-D-alanine carboxypeptidase [Robertmurraya korlensis]
MRKKVFVLIIITFFILFHIPVSANTNINVSSQYAVLMEQSSGRVLFEKGAHEKRRIASITKIMTAVLAIESGKLNEMVKVSKNATRAEGSSLYLKENEEVKLEDLVYGLMLRSGNDAAVAIAEYIGGSVEGFAFLMNQKADEIGMLHSHFTNPHGLDDSNDHYSTAYDMAILTRYAMMNDTYKLIAGTEVHRAPNPTESWDRVWRNKNRLLTELYDYSTGGKTGFTKLAKRTLVSTATKDGMDLIAVTLNGPDDWNDHINMFETAFKTYEMVQVVEKGFISGIQSDKYKNKAVVKHDFLYPVIEAEKDEFELEYKLKQLKSERNIPEVIGELIITFDDQPIKTMPIYYNNEKEETSFFESFKKVFTTMIGVNANG